MGVKINFKQYITYLFRWQLSTPILTLVLSWLATLDKWIATVIANFIGGLVFFWLDRFIFNSKILSAQWEVKEDIQCFDCDETARGYRLVKTKNYDRTADKKPQFRCEECSKKKTKLLISKGVVI